eukprot:gene4917-biopygen6677
MLAAPPSLLARPHKQVELEIQLHHQLQHNPHVVPFWLSAEDSSQLHIITQYCRDGDLRQKMSTSLSETAVRNQVARPLLHALTDLHSRGFVHRDVKPENCFLSDDQVQLGDFGLAAMCGTGVPAAAGVGPHSGTQHPLLACSSMTSAGSLQGSGGSSDTCTGSYLTRTIPASSSSNSLLQLQHQQQQNKQLRNNDSSTGGVTVCSPRHEAAGTPAYTAPEVLMSAFNSPSKCSAVGPQPATVAKCPMSVFELPGCASKASGRHWHFRRGIAQAAAAAAAAPLQSLTDALSFVQNDIWSLGVLVLECLSGQHPFAEHCGNPGALMWAIAHSAGISLNHLPVTNSCKQWLSAALAVNPAQRATAQQLLEHPWMETQLPAAGAWEPLAASDHKRLAAPSNHVAQLAGTCNNLLACTADDDKSCFSTPMRLPGVMPGPWTDAGQPWDGSYAQAPSASTARWQNHTFDGALLPAYGNVVTSALHGAALCSNSSSGCEVYSRTGQPHGRDCDSAHTAKACQAATEPQSSILSCNTQGCSQQYGLGKQYSVASLPARSFASWED